MKTADKLELRASEIRTRLAELAGIETQTDETRAEISYSATEYADTEVRFQAAKTADDTPPETVTQTAVESAEDVKLRELRSNVSLGGYIGAAIGRTGVTGAELEYNQHLGLPNQDHFPLELLTRDAETEQRAAVDGDAGTSQSSWIERLFSDTAAMHLGVSMPSVAPGVTRIPGVGIKCRPQTARSHSGIR